MFKELLQSKWNSLMNKVQMHSLPLTELNLSCMYLHTLLNELTHTHTYMNINAYIYAYIHFTIITCK